MKSERLESLRSEISKHKHDLNCLVNCRSVMQHHDTKNELNYMIKSLENRLANQEKQLGFMIQHDDD